MPNTLIPIVAQLDAGVIKDIPSPSLVPGGWTDVRNMSFDNGVARKAKGEAVVLTPTINPYFLMAAPILSSEFWVIGGLVAIHAFEGTTQADITRASGPYTGGVIDYWNGGMFHSIPFINNGVDLPQVWTIPALGTPLIDMTSWPATQKAKVVRAFKTYLFALDVTKSGSRNERMIKWSSSAPPEALPATWDETDATKDAGEFILAEGSSSIIDGVQLGDSFLIYTQDSVWSGDYIGGAFIFRFRKLFSNLGVIAQDCAVPFQQNHFVVDQKDVCVHNGTSIECIADTKVRRWLFDNMNDEFTSATRVVKNIIDTEIWICFPYRESSDLNRALIWNWKFNSWTIRDLPSIMTIHSSPRNPFVDADVWSQATGGWDTETLDWNGELLSASKENALFMSPPDLTGIVRIGNEFQFSGSNYTSFLERRGIPAIDTGTGEFVPIESTRLGRIIQDVDRHRLGLGIKPIIEAVDGLRVFVSFGSHDTINGTITWEGPEPFIVGIDDKVDLYPSGKFLALRIEDKGNVEWKLMGYIIEVAGQGRY